MTKEEAIKLRVSKDKFFVFEPTLEEILEYTVTGVNLIERPINTSSNIRVAGNCKALMTERYFEPHEIFANRIEALERFAAKCQFKSDQALHKKAAIIKQIADIRKDDERYG